MAETISTIKVASLKLPMKMLSHDSGSASGRRFDPKTSLRRLICARREGRRGRGRERGLGEWTDGWRCAARQNAWKDKERIVEDDA
jgi:hypothetical protein